MTGDRARGTDAPRRVVFLSSHVWRSPNAAGFHHMARAACGMGWDVTFATVGISPLAIGRRAARRRLSAARPFGRPVIDANGVRAFTWFTPFHPVNLRWAMANRLVAPLYERFARLPWGGLLHYIEAADVVVVESSHALALVDRVRRAAPNAAIVYRQSDVPDAVGFHPMVTEHERRSLDTFDLIAVPERSRLEYFRGARNVVLVPHGVSTELFESAHVSPYPPGRRAAVFVGMDGLDTHAVISVATAAPNLDVYLIGPWTNRGLPANVHALGVLAYRETAAWIRHADVGLNCVQVQQPRFRSETLKVLQYRYCGLPVVTPGSSGTDHETTFTYRMGDRESIQGAVRDALAAGRRPMGGAGASWEVRTAELLDRACASVG